MSATIIDGKAIADQWLADIAEQVQALGVPVHVAALCVGVDPGLRTFLKIKQKAAQSVGITFSNYFFDTDDQAGASDTLRYLAGDDEVHGVLVELPLPPSWDRDATLALIPAAKDVDLISPVGEKSFYTDVSPILPPAVAALKRALDVLNVVVAGKHVTVVGQGRLVGLPIAHWLRSQGAMGDVIDIHTADAPAVARRADVLITGAGVPGLITGEWIKDGAFVVDFGYKDGKGDVDHASVISKAGALTPVPGGMGPLVVAAVLENVLALATRT